MIRACYYFYVAAVLLFLSAASGTALAETEGQPARKNAAMEKRIQDAADKAAANEIAVKNFRFAEMDCQLPPIPSINDTLKLERDDLFALEKMIKAFTLCVDQAKITDYEAVKDLIANRLGGTYTESDKKISFNVTKNVAKEVAGLFNQAGEAYASRFSSHEVAKAKYNKRVQEWNSFQKFKAEFENKQEDKKNSPANP